MRYFHVPALNANWSRGDVLSESLVGDVTARPIRIERGHVEISNAAGLGIEVDEDRLRRYRRDVPMRQVA